MTTAETFDTAPLLEELSLQEARTNAAKHALIAARKYLTEQQALLWKIRNVLQDPNAAKLEVSDHAVLRYAERTLGLNSEEVGRAIRAKVAPLSAVLGDGKYPVGCGCMAVVTNGTAVTVLPKE